MGTKITYGINTSCVRMLQYGQHNETSISSNRLVEPQGIVDYLSLLHFIHYSTSIIQLQ